MNLKNFNLIACILFLITCIPVSLAQDSVAIKQIDSLGVITKKLWYKDTDSSKVMAEMVIQLSEEHQYQAGIANGNSLMGVVHDVYGNYALSLEYYKKSKDIYIQLGDEYGIANVQYNMGLIFQNDKQYEKALEYVQLATDYYSIHELKSKLAMSKMTIGNLYVNLDKNLSISTKPINESLQLAYELQDTLYICSALNLLGNAYIKKRTKIDSAIYCFTLSIDHMDHLQNPWNLAYSYNGLAEAYLMLNNIEKASLYNNNALEKYLSINQKWGVKDAYEKKVQILEASGNYKDANEALKMYTVYDDSIYSEQQSKQINRLKAEYEAEKKEAEISKLTQQSAIQRLEIKQKNQMILIAIIIGLVFFILIYMLYRQKMIVANQKNTELEQRFLRSQLNPHFIFNALGSIQNFMLKNNLQQAGIYLAKFSKLMRQILENSRQEYIYVEEEVKMLDNYLAINQLQLNHAFQYEIIVAEEINLEEDLIPPMFVQPFVENAIKHGIDQHDNKGKISINFKKERNYIYIEITDNGQGLITTKTKDHKSLATTIIKERIALFNKHLKNKIELFVTEIEGINNQMIGTKVEIKMPFK